MARQLIREAQEATALAIVERGNANAKRMMALVRQLLELIEVQQQLALGDVRVGAEPENLDAPGLQLLCDGGGRVLPEQGGRNSAE